MDAQQIKGLAVVSLAEANNLGRVQDVMFRLSPLEVAGLDLATELGDRLLPISHVRSIGPDAVTTDTEVEASEGEATLRREDLRGLDALGKLKVVDLDGGYLGNITRLDVDPTSGAVKTVDVRKGNLLGVGGDTRTIDRDAVVAVGPELVTVDSGGTSDAGTQT